MQTLFEIVLQISFSYDSNQSKIWNMDKHILLHSCAYIEHLNKCSTCMIDQITNQLLPVNMMAKICRFPTPFWLLRELA